MSRQFAFPVFGAVAALLSFTAIPTSSSHAIETCLAAPNAPAPQGSHWFYRVERPSLRKCWRLVKRDEQPQRSAKRAAPQPEPAEEIDVAPAAETTERVAQSAPQHGWLTRSASAVPEAVAPLQASDPLNRTSERADDQVSAPPAPVVQEQPSEAVRAPVAPPQTAQPQQTTVAQPPAAAAPTGTGMLQFVFVVIAAIGLLAAAIFFFIDMRRRRTDVLTRIARDDEATFETPDEDAPTFSAMPPITLAPQHDDVDEAVLRSRRRRMAA